jgi:biotin carboxylase/drug/metabolite transporter (DMT)-like permease
MQDQTPDVTTESHSGFSESWKRYQGYVYLILLFVSGGISTIATKHLMNEGMSPYQALCYSSIVGVILLAITHQREGWAFYRFATSKKDALVLGTAAMLGFVVYEMSYNVALEAMPAQHTSILYYTYPIFLYLASYLFPGEKVVRITRWGVAGILICFSGAALLALANSSKSATSLNAHGVVAMCITIAAYTAYSMLCKAYQFREVHFVFLGQVLSIVFCSAVITAQGQWMMPNASAWLLLLVMAVFYNILNQILYIRAIKLFSAEKFSALVYFSPLVTCLMAAWFLGEALTVVVAGALGLIIMGNLLIAMKAEKKSKSDDSSGSAGTALPVVVVVDMESSGVLYYEALQKRPVKTILYYTLAREKWEELVASGCVASPAMDDLAHGAELYFEENYQQFVSALEARGVRVAAVIPGSEKGVEVADILAQHFSVPGNQPQTIVYRRNKAEMKKAAHQAGLRCAQYQECYSLSDAILFAQQKGFPVVLKTPSGAGTHHVFVCHSEAELQIHFHTILGEENIYGQRTSFALVEEYIGGTEYVVDLFGTGDGVVVTDLWRYEKIANEHGKNIYYNVVLEDLHSPKHQALKEYAIKLAVAVGIEIGPVHAEIKVDDGGPIMIEIASRLPGCKIPYATIECSNFNIVEASVDVYLHGVRKLAAPIHFHKLANVAYVPTSKQGKVLGIAGLDAITSLSSYVHHGMDVAVGKHLRPSTDLTNIPLVSVFSHKQRSKLFDDVAKARTLFHIETDMAEKWMPTAIVTESRLRMV